MAISLRKVRQRTPDYAMASYTQKGGWRTGKNANDARDSLALSQISVRSIGMRPYRKHTRNWTVTAEKPLD
jgi:hypothetical protein